jgi:hypothetical protein
MDPSSNESRGIQLPAPLEALPTPAKAEQSEPQHSPEQAPVAPEKQEASSPAPAVSAVPPIVPLPMPVQPASNQTQATIADPAAATLPAAADDNDLIDKEWVNKAKAIIEQTKGDPYKQSDELTMVKADFMQKRYNKAIKVSK